MDLEMVFSFCVLCGVIYQEADDVISRLMEQSWPPISSLIGLPTQARPGLAESAYFPLNPEPIS